MASSNDDVGNFSFTWIRQCMTPWLPPPMVELMNKIDNHPSVKTFMQTHDYDMEEPSTLLLVTILIVLLTWKILSLVSYSSSSTIIKDDDVEKFVVETKSNSESSYDDTVVLLGPSGGGKTTLFHAMQQYHEQQQQQTHASSISVPMTLMSMKANTTILTSSTNNIKDDNGGKISIRLMDYPGYYLICRSDTKNDKTVMSDDKKIDHTNYIQKKIVFVLDSARPIPTEAAQTLHDIILRNNTNNNIQILVACHKSDLSNAKHWRRIKIQLRTELERWRRVKATTQKDTLSSNTSTATEHENLPPYSDLDKLPNNVTMHFISSSSHMNKNSKKNRNSGNSEYEGLDEIWQFVLHGTIIHDSSPISSTFRK